MTARQMAFPGAPEHAHAARQWVAEQARHPYADLLTAELWNAVVAVCTESVLMTVTTRGSAVRITAHGARLVPPGALTVIGRQIVSTLADRYGVAPDGCGIYAEIEVSR